MTSFVEESVLMAVYESVLSVVVVYIYSGKPNSTRPVELTLLIKGVIA